MFTMIEKGGESTYILVFVNKKEGFYANFRSLKKFGDRKMVPEFINTRSGKPFSPY